MEINSFKYSDMQIERIACQYEDSKQSISFRGSIKATNNEKIMVSLYKMNIPVAKVLLTPDSVKFVNFYNKTYLLDDYDYLSGLLNMDLDFQTVNAIISNNVFSYRDEKGDNAFREFNCEVDSGLYVLKSMKTRKLDKVIRKGNDKKADRILKKIDEDQRVAQTLYIDPVSYKLRRIILNDQVNKRKVQINFSDFVPLGDQLYPGQIDLSFTNEKENLKMSIKMSKLSLEKNEDFNFKIPERFDRAN